MSLNIVYLKRELGHPIDLIFNALTDPVSIIQWFGPLNTHTKSAEVDLRLGGQYSFEIVPEQGANFYIEGEYLIIEPLYKLQFTLNYRGLPKNTVGESIVTLTLATINQGTTISLKQELKVVPTNMEHRTKSWEAMMDRLSELTIA